MAGPWVKYQQQPAQDGPWARYQRVTDLPAVRAQVAPEDQPWGHYFPAQPRPGILEAARMNRPELANIPDAQLASRIRSEFYSDIPADQFYRQTGLAEQLGYDWINNEADPTAGMSGLDLARAGAGKMMVDTARGARQLGVEAAGLLGSDRARERAQELRAEETERQQRDAPLMRADAALAGYAGGMLAPMGAGAYASRGTRALGAFLPSTARGSAAQGAALGALQPVGEDESRTANVAFGGAAGAGGHALGRTISRWTPGAREAMGEADRLGLNLRGTPGEQVHQLSEAAGRLVPDSRGDAMIGIRQGLQEAREAARQGVDASYDAARSARAAVPMAEVQAFSGGARRALAEQGFDVGSMPGVARRLDELDQLAATPGARAAQLRALEQWRRRVNAMSPKDGSPEMAASTALKRRYDDFMTDLFNRDMIEGSTDALQAWRQARGDSARFHSTFNANRVIRDLATKDDLTPEQMRSWLFNVGGSGAKLPAGAVVKRLNDILGADSPQMQALRSEVVADLADPLLQRTPNIKAFLDRYDTYFKRNPTLIRELFPEGAGDLQQVQMFARGIERRPGARISVEGDKRSQNMFGSLQRLLTAKMFGHGIAEGGARMQAARSMIDRLRSSTVGSQARKDILREYLGADPRQPMFPRGAGTVGSVSSSAVMARAPDAEDGLNPGP